MDEISRKLLRILQVEGRITNQELASRCNISPAACFERLKRLRKSGVIKGYNAIIDPASVDLELMLLIAITLDRTTDDVFTLFAKKILQLPEVLECLLVVGGFDYLVKVRIKNMAAYREFVERSLSQLPNVRETRTYAVMEEVKSTSQLPL